MTFTFDNSKGVPEALVQLEQAGLLRRTGTRHGRSVWEIVSDSELTPALRKLRDELLPALQSRPAPGEN